MFLSIDCFFYFLNCLISSSREERKIDLAYKIKMMEGGLVLITVTVTVTGFVVIAVTVSGEVLYIIDATIKDQSQFRRSNQ